MYGAVPPVTVADAVPSLNPLQLTLVVVMSMCKLSGAVMLNTLVVVHPVASNTVTVYVPGLVTLMVEVVPTIAEPFDHEYVPPPVAVNVIDCVVHVKMLVVGMEIAALGNGLTVIVSAVVVTHHPVAGVNVYVVVV